MKRLFIEIDRIDKEYLETLSRLAQYMFHIPSKKHTKKFFHKVIDEAFAKGAELWNAVKKHDQFFVSSSLIPLSGSPLGSGMLMNNLMNKAVKEGITGKELYFFRDYKNIWWEELEPETLKECFKNNKLFCADEESDNWISIDIDKLLKEKFDL